MDIQETIHELFEERVSTTPHHHAAIFKDQSVTYRQLNERSNQIAHHLLALGTHPSTPIAICMEASPDLLSVLLAILKVGGTYIPLDPSHPETRLLFTLSDNNKPLVITTSGTKDRFSHYQGHVMVLEHDGPIINQKPIHNPNIKVKATQLAYIIYTSGSTGKPKGVLIEHKSVVNYCRWFASYAGCMSQHQIDFSSNYIFDMAVTTSIVPLMLGMTTVIGNGEIKKGVRHYLKYLAHNRVNMIKLTPSYFKVLLHEVKTEPITLPQLQTIILGGENLPTADCAAWLTIYPQHLLFNEYGPTEATVAISQYQVSEKNLPTITSTSIPIGQPGPYMACYILDPHHNLITNDEPGELCIAGPCLARGYLNQPELTQQQFIQIAIQPEKLLRLYKTGDLCKRLPDGMIAYIGRIDNQVKIRGFRIEPGEVERHLSTHPAIKDVVVLAQKDEYHEKLIAYYILSDIHITPHIGEFQKYLGLRLPEYMIPSAFVRVDTFPLTTNGKLDRQALPIPRFTTNQHYLAPSTPLEKTIAAIWAEELGIKLVGIEDNFFELGGHSLSAARIISKISQTLGKEITLREFYEATTIKKLLSAVYHEKQSEEKSAMLDTIVPDEDAVLPLSDFQLLLWLSNLFEAKAKAMNIVARKRVHGKLDKRALQFAFKAVLKKHEILNCRILKIKPAHRLQKDLLFDLIERNIASLSHKDNERVLLESIDELSHDTLWSKDKVLLCGRVFHLKDEETELQIAMPHIISDDISPDIIFSDLSSFYLQYCPQSKLDDLPVNRRYRDYQLHEQFSSRDHIKKDMVFWENYLRDAFLFQFPSTYLVKNMKDTQFSYSTYEAFPSSALNKLQQFCAENCISFHDGICAALGLALVRCCGGMTYETKHLFMNIVKSTRGNQLYDDTVGCFLNLEPIKVSLNINANLTSLAKQIHQSTMYTAPHQQCSSLIKLACIATLKQKRSYLKKYLVNSLIYLYTKWLPTPTIDSSALRLCERLITSKKTNHFAINVNVHKRFINNTLDLNRTAELFGYKLRKTIKHFPDLIEIDRFLDVCLLRDDSENMPYIVISANLKPDFRTQLAKAIIHIIETETNVPVLGMANIYNTEPDDLIESQKSYEQEAVCE